MKKIAKFVLDHKKTVLTIFILAVILSIFAQSKVKINYNLTDYLPDEAPSTIALEVMNKEYTKATPNARVYIPNVSITQALEYKERLKQLEGIEGVDWLDDVTSIYLPIETMDTKLLQTYYKDGGALFTVTINEDKSITTIDEIRSIIGEQGAISGEAVDKAAAQQSTGNEIQKIMLFVIPMILIILLITTNSWFEPIIFLVTIGVSIMINEGTNLFLGEISFITKTTSSILQLAVSMDYAIFILDSFSHYRQKGMDVKTAMYNAMCKSASSILASGLTTLLGFAALTIMRFKIGPDMGIVLGKGIIFSLLSVLFFLPILAVYSYQLIDKTSHKSFIPSFEKLAKIGVKVSLPLIIAIVVIVIPCFMAQSHNTFMYGSSGMNGPETKVGQDRELINNKFGESVQIALMVPRGEWAKEKQVNEEIKQIKEVTSVISYVDKVGKEIPTDFAGEDAISQLVSKNYSRFVLSVATPDEGEEAFQVVEKLRSIANSYYGENYQLVGGSVNNYDMKETITKDNLKVNIASILAIGLVLLCTFKSISIPIVLILTIEASIWINLSFPYFGGDTLNYIGYLVISTVQLGATVDYAILFSERYLQNREKVEKKEAGIKTIRATAPSILTSAGILAIAGFTIGIVSTNGVISQLGTLIGRGAVLSAVLVLLFLPGILMLLDKVIQKTTFKKIKEEEK